MSLFNTLLRLQSSKIRLEDYLTEIFTHILQTEPEVMNAFVKLLKVDAGDEHFHASTQVSFLALEGHHSGSRPDLVLQSVNHLIMVESKVGSKERYEQLKRYAEHLDKQEIKNKTLLYLTKNYDPKDEAEIFVNCRKCKDCRDKNRDTYCEKCEGIKFQYLQWYQIYQMLTPFRDNLLVKEIQHFLKVNHMSANNQFSPTDILSLSNFSRVTTMLNRVLDNEVKTQFETSTGSNFVSRRSKYDPTDRQNQFFWNDRYVLTREKNNGLYIILGFWFNSNDEKEEYPSLRLEVALNVKPGTGEEWTKIQEIFKKKENSKAKNSELSWQAYNLGKPKDWSNISLTKSMKDILSKEDHLSACAEMFLDFLKDFEKMKENGLEKYLD